MLKSTCKARRKSASKAFDDYVSKVRKKMSEIGEEAVGYAVEHGDYHNVTGKLRASNGYRVEGLTLRIFNDAGYADEVESRGKDVIGGAVLFAEQRLKEEFE